MFRNYLHKEIVSFVLTALFMGGAFGNDGICEKNELTTKSRPARVYKTYTRSYWGQCGGRSWRYSCWKYETAGDYITELEYYTEMELKQYCCPGYENTNPIPFPELKCIPICDFTCSNGKCSKPNFCECNSGYSKKAGTENICDPVCSEECVHGYCSKPETCTCDPGYQPSLSSPYVCEPECSEPCVNANCTSPDICSCWQGFAKTPREPNKCHAVCSAPCHNGICTAPDECTCFEGYERNNSAWNVCSPVCPNGCENGDCTAPGECTCFHGFENTGNVCEAKCTRECLNGACTRPEICTCHPGYQSSSDDPYSCFPVCSPECINGNCTDPNICECFPGFIKSSNPSTCQPHCSNGCNNGICVKPEKCACLWGFEDDRDSSNCTQQEVLDCIFNIRLLYHDFDKVCFTFSGELPLTDLKNCNILRYLASHSEQLENTVFHLSCESTSYVTIKDNKFQLHMDCTMNLYSTETLVTDNLNENLDNTFKSTSILEIPSPTTSTNDLQFETDDLSSTTNDLPLTTDDLPFTLPLELQSVTGQSPLEATTFENIHKTEFDISPSDGLSSITTKLSTVPLDLNITLKFHNLVTRLQMTKDYFRNVTSLKEEVCLCPEDRGNWRICTSFPVSLHLCPCKPKKSYNVIESDNVSYMRILKIIFFFCITATVVGLIFVYLRNLQYNIFSVVDADVAPSIQATSINLDTLRGG